MKKKERIGMDLNMNYHKITAPIEGLLRNHGDFQVLYSQLYEKIKEDLPKTVRLKDKDTGETLIREYVANDMMLILHNKTVPLLYSKGILITQVKDSTVKVQKWIPGETPLPNIEEFKDERHANDYVWTSNMLPNIMREILKLESLGVAVEDLVKELSYSTYGKNRWFIQQSRKEWKKKYLKDLPKMINAAIEARAISMIENQEIIVDESINDKAENVEEDIELEQ